jgi:PAS domain S-box-containing protein
VDSEAGKPSGKDLHDLREAIAQQWYHALASIGGFQLDRTEALEKFTDLTDQAIAFLLAERPETAAAKKIGEDLASLPCINSLAIEISGQLWVRLLFEGGFEVEPAKMHPRILALLTGMSSGFVRRAREVELEEQEDIRLAMAANLLRTTEELRKYQSKLEVMLAERTRELAESEEQFRAIAETSMNGVYQSTEDSQTGGLIYVNNAFAKMLGYDRQELIGKSTLSLLVEEDLPKLSQVTPKLRGQSPVEGEFRLRHKDGHFVDIHFSVVPTLLNGRIVRSGILQDITERKRVQEALFESEERYRTLAEASPDMIYIINQDDQIQYINSFAAAFINLPAEEIIGQARERFFPSPSNDHHKRDLMKVLTQGDTIYDENETRINDKSTWLGTWLVPMRGVSGEISAVMGVSRDITKQKHAEMEILRSRDQLEKRVEERTIELRNSQTQLRQLTDQLVSAMEDERRHISRELHDEAGQALISLKYSLASLQSDIPDDDLPAKRRLVDAMSTIDQVMQQFRTLTHDLRPPALEIVGIDLCLRDYCEEFTKRTGLSIHYQGETIPDLPDELGISLYRFVQEALTNIVKHARATKVEVKLRQMKQQVVLTVSDNGRGMEASPHSDGIGLLGIQERLKLLGGFLEIHSRKSKGVNITAHVPWTKAHETPGKRPTARLVPGK